MQHALPSIADGKARQEVATSKTRQRDCRDMSAFQLGDEFPREGFVQAALERNFANCELFEAGWADFACIDEDGQRWVIEAKGETADTGLDFRTGLGQLLQGIGDPETRYALAMPDTPKFEGQRARVPEWVRTALNLYWLLVEAGGEVVAIPPPDGRTSRG